MARPIDAYQAIDIIDEWLDSVGTVMVGKGLSSYGELIGCIEDAPTLTPPNEPRMINADKLAKRIAGHGNYHGDSILAAIYCAADGKENDAPIRPIETTPNEWMSKEQLWEMDGVPIWVVDTSFNRSEWCYWKDGLAYSCEAPTEYYDLDDYGKWLAYSRPPEGEA